MSIVITPDSKITEAVDLIVEDLSKRELVIAETGFGAWSPSKIKTLTKCPLQFLLRNVLRVEYSIPIDPSLEENDDRYLASIGKSAHFIMEEMVNKKTYEEALASSREEFHHEVTDHHWHRVEVLEDNLRNFMYRLERFSADTPISAMHTERMYAVDRDWKPVHHNSPTAYFRGIIDLSVLLENFDSLLIDHKHGGTAKYGIKNYRFQLNSYSIFLVAHDTAIRGVTPMIHFMQEGDLASGDYLSRDQILNECTKSVDSAIIGAIDILKEKRAFVHATSNLCSYCDFQNICRGGKRGTANYLQPIVEASKIFFKS